MPLPESEYLAVLERPDGIDRLLAEGVPLHRIEAMLDQIEHQRQAGPVARPKEAAKSGLLGRLRWS
jgi:hypothetical protein